MEGHVTKYGSGITGQGRCVSVCVHVYACGCVGVVCGVFAVNIFMCEYLCGGHVHV